MKKFKNFLSVAISAILIFNFSAFPASAEQSSKSVYLGGESFGVRFYSSGVMIIQLEGFYDGEKYVCPAEKGGLQVNDVIKEVNGKAVTCNEDFQKISESSSGKTLHLEIERNGKTCSKEITPVKNTVGVYLIGAWIRDSCAGIGTITYYDPDNNYFAALGHGICDSDTKALMPLASAEILKANISSVTKSCEGCIGTLNGYFTDKTLGLMTKNSKLGIYSTNDNEIWQTKNKIEIAELSEIRVGDAEIYTTLDNDEVKSYDIKIVGIRNNSSNSNENFVIKVTDVEILNKCGGIVQGMSGSPIVQNGKLVGAVTHVFVNSPEKGYGIFAQNMVLNSQV